MRNDTLSFLLCKKHELNSIEIRMTLINYITYLSRYLDNSEINAWHDYDNWR